MIFFRMLMAVITTVACIITIGFTAILIVAAVGIIIGMMVLIKNVLEIYF